MLAHLSQLSDLFWHFLMLSLVAIGGASSTITDMHRYLVEGRGWMSSEQFSALYAISQAAPGPNVLFVALFGWQVAGVAGAVVSMAGICGPSSLLALGFEALAGRHPHSRWPDLLRKSLAPLSIGLLLATGWVLARSVDSNVPTLGLTGVATLVAYRSRLHPLWLIALGAGLGAAGLLA